ncbi:MAG TPA: hypothetical protein VHA06_02775 [Candidatus Angelobacter sp.]|jgi:hypothetical protein|nr:hypothetical protein [Candidatus Angelobacter sp.]
MNIHSVNISYLHRAISCQRPAQKKCFAPHGSLLISMAQNQTKIKFYVPISGISYFLFVRKLTCQIKLKWRTILAEIQTICETDITFVAGSRSVGGKVPGNARELSGKEYRRYAAKKSPCLSG